jgi:hypothetical protein
MRAAAHTHTLVPHGKLRLRCTGCGLLVEGEFVARQLPRPEFFTVVLLALIGFVTGSVPVHALPKPEYKALEEVRRLTIVSAALDRDTTEAWGRALGNRCRSDECRGFARTEAQKNRARIAPAIANVERTRLQLESALLDAEACAHSGTYPCARYTPGIVAARKQAFAEAVSALEAEVEARRLSRDTDSP